MKIEVISLNEKAPEKERIKGQMKRYLNRLNCTCKIDYNIYSEIFDISIDLLDEMYELGKSEAKRSK
jgi:hypothetical protein